MSSKFFKKGQSLLVLTLAMLAITARVLCYQAEVIDISGDKYFPAVKEAIAKAQGSIYTVMYLVEFSAERANSKANQLVDALIEAKKRGVEVEVVFDQDAGSFKNAKAYTHLKEAGIRVYYDELSRYTHAKCLVIDKKIIIAGSTNWSEAALDRNIEVSFLLESEELAQGILSYLKTIKTGQETDTGSTAVQVSREFLENPDFAPFMVKEQSQRAFDVYLYLIWKGTVPIFYDDIARYLGIYEGWTSEAYRRQIIRTFRQLESKYKLIKFKPRYAKEADVELVNFRDSPQKAGTVSIPEDYFKFGWNKELSLRAKFCYLINLAYTQISQMKPYWSKSVAMIAKEFGGVGQDVIHKGMLELRRRKLLEVKYDELGSKPYDERAPKIYKLLKLYDPKELEAKLKALEEKYGRQDFSLARKYAQIVFEENNPEVIEDIILKTEQYGQKKVKKAFDIVAQKSIDNSKRTYIYAVGIIEK